MIIKDEVVEYEYEEIFNKWRMFDGTFTVLRDEYGEVLAVCRSGKPDHRLRQDMEIVTKFTIFLDIIMKNW